MTNVLNSIKEPADLASLSEPELAQLCVELRERIIGTVSRTGGHLAPNLGTVELTVALLRVFRPPHDKLVWDTGHQAYAYKLLTGRNDRFDTIRQYGGISGFLKRTESEYDAFGAGHAGTAISAALGMASAMDLAGAEGNAVAIVGDAAITNGISLEALNNAATTTNRIIVVLNDNEMSIDRNVGALSRSLGGMLANPSYNKWKNAIEDMGHKMRMGWLRKGYYRMEESLKAFFLRSAFFEELGLRYIGPVDGHDLPSLIDAFSIARDDDRPVLLHVSTRKGKGYPPAEASPDRWHGCGGFDVATGETAPKSGLQWSKVFGQSLVRIAEKDERVVAITPAMCQGTGLPPFCQAFHDRMFDVGICEEHAAVFAAGLAAAGKIPVLAVYSTFMQRAVDCLMHDICLQDLPVVVCLDRAGLVGDDGPTHHGVFDIAMMRSIPGLIYMQPRNAAELEAMLVKAVELQRPCVIRYPRGSCPEGDGMLPDIAVGRAEVLREGTDVQIWALGDMVPVALAAAELLAADSLSVGVVNARFIKPLDRDLARRQGPSTKLFVTMENGVVAGGFGSALGEVLGEEGVTAPLLRLGIPDAFVRQGPVKVLFEDLGLTPEGVHASVKAALDAGQTLAKSPGVRLDECSE